MRVLSLCSRVDADREPVLERKPPVTRDVIRMGVRLDRANEPHAAPLGLLEVLLDRVRRVDDDRLTRALVADQVRGAPESVVDELREEHSAATVAPSSAISLEVLAARSRASSRVAAAAEGSVYD